MTNEEVRALIGRLQRYAETWYDGRALTTTSRAPKLAADISAAADALTALLARAEAAERKAEVLERQRNEWRERTSQTGAQLTAAESALATVRRDALEEAAQFASAAVRALANADVTSEQPKE